MSRRKPRFIVVRTVAGWHVRFMAANNRVVWTTQVYSNESSAYKAIHFLRGTVAAREWVDIDHEDERTP